MNAWTLGELESRLTELSGSDSSEQDDRARIRRRILEVATDHFVRFGYRKANIADIARDVGVGKGTIYLYFDSKKTLALAAVAVEKMTLLPGLKAVMERPESERLQAYLELGLRFIFTARLNAALVRGDRELTALMHDLGEERIEADRERGLGFIEQLIGRPAGLSEARLRSLAQVLSMVMPLAAHLADEERRLGMSVDDFVAEYAGILARGVVAGERR